MLILEGVTWSAVVHDKLKQRRAIVNMQCARSPPAALPADPYLKRPSPSVPPRLLG